MNDLPKMKIQFDVAISICFEISEGDYHYDDTEEKTIWIIHDAVTYPVILMTLKSLK